MEFHFLKIYFHVHDHHCNNIILKAEERRGKQRKGVVVKLGDTREKEGEGYPHPPLCPPAVPARSLLLSRLEICLVLECVTHQLNATKWRPC